MEHWNMRQVDDRKHVLQNKTGTLITVRKSGRVDMPAIFDQIENVRFPLKYTEGLREIRFTKMQGTLSGWYQFDRVHIKIGSGFSTRVYCELLCHEIGHHVDHVENISSEPWIIREKKEHGHEMYMPYALKNVFEYVACGFETYYCGTNYDKKRLKKFNPFLNGVIETLHKKYRTR